MNQNGRFVVIPSDSVKEAAESSELVKTKTISIDFLPIQSAPVKRGRTKKSSRVSLVVGLIVACIILVLLVIAVWHAKKRYTSHIFLHYKVSLITIRSLQRYKTVNIQRPCHILVIEHFAGISHKV